MKTLCAFFGQNRVNPDAYGGWVGELPGCRLDALNLSILFARIAADPQDRILTRYSDKFGRRVPGYATEFPPADIILQCTLAEWERITSEFAAQAEAGDRVILGNSGHGTTYPSFEYDGLSGGICFADGILTEKKLWRSFAKFKSGVKLAFICDFCFAGEQERSGRRTRSAHANGYFRSTPFLEPEERATPKCSIFFLHACKEWETAGDSPQGGLFTLGLLSVWESMTLDQQAATSWRQWLQLTQEFFESQKYTYQHPDGDEYGPPFADEPILPRPA